LVSWSFFRRLLQIWFRRRRPDDPRDPYSRVRQPKPRRPDLRSSAIALAEPDEAQTVIATGSTRARISARSLR
jgi:hypothetical protein